MREIVSRCYASSFLREYIFARRRCDRSRARISRYRPRSPADLHRSLTFIRHSRILSLSAFALALLREYASSLFHPATPFPAFSHLSAFQNSHWFFLRLRLEGEKRVYVGKGTAGSTDSKRKVSFFSRESTFLGYPFFLSPPRAVRK